jgi:hypothetical protein
MPGGPRRTAPPSRTRRVTAGGEDQDLHARFAASIAELFPGRLPERAEAIAARAASRGSERNPYQVDQFKGVWSKAAVSVAAPPVVLSTPKRSPSRRRICTSS